MSFTENYRNSTKSSLPTRGDMQKQKQEENKNTNQNDAGSFALGFINALRWLNPLGGITKFIPVQTLAKGAADTAVNAATGIAENVFGTSLNSEEQPQQQTEAPVEETPAPVEEDNSDVIEYTYKPGDTFGQVIKDLGLGTANGLWGDNGDVNYYTQQLVDQGVWADGVPSNIPIGTTIKLKRRK